MATKIMSNNGEELDISGVFIPSEPLAILRPKVGDTFVNVPECRLVVAVSDDGVDYVNVWEYENIEDARKAVPNTCSLRSWAAWVSTGAVEGVML